MLRQYPPSIDRRLAKSRIALLVAGLGSVVCSAGLGAQTLKDVVVSASRSEQRSFDAAAAVQVIDRDTIEGAGPQVNLSESLNRVPGLTILNRQNYAQDLQLSIRGFGARSAFGIRGIRLLIDGIPATTPDGQGQGSSVSLTSTDRMEVLRGPLALLYGNSSGGVIQAFTRDAPLEPEFGAQYYVGSFGMHRSDWQYAGKLGTDATGQGGVGLVANYSTFDIGGYRANSNTERKQFNGKASFDLGTSTKMNVVFNRFDMPLAQDPLGLTAAQLAANPEQAGTNAAARGVRKVVLQNQLGTSLVHRIDKDRSLTARVYYGNRENLQYQVGVAATATALGAWVGLNRDYYGAGLQYNASSNVGGVPVNWAAGIELDTSSERRQGGAAASGQKTTTTRNEVNRAGNNDAFAQGTFLLSEKISLIAGLRYSQVNFNSQDEYLVDGNGSGSTSYTAANPVLGVTWHVNDVLNLYANMGKGFESPTLAEVAYNGAGVPAFNTAINAASSRHFEMGAKWAPSAQSRVDFTLYRIDTTDEIVVASNTGGNSTFKNAPGTSRNGFELSATNRFGENWRGTLSASAIDAQFSQTFTTNAVTVVGGNKIPGIPQSSVFAELLWGTNLGSPRSSGTHAGLEWIQSGRLYANDTNTVSVDGFSTLAAKVNHVWKIGKNSLSTYLRIDNLLDERYVGSVIVNQAAAQFYESAPGRNWTLGFKLNVPL